MTSGTHVRPLCFVPNERRTHAWPNRKVLEAMLLRTQAKSDAMWRGWLYASKIGPAGPSGYCTDCTPAFQAQEKLGGRCQHPGVTFIHDPEVPRNEFDPRWHVIGVRPEVKVGRDGVVARGRPRGSLNKIKTSTVAQRVKWRAQKDRARRKAGVPLRKAAV